MCTKHIHWVVRSTTSQRSAFAKLVNRTANLHKLSSIFHSRRFSALGSALRCRVSRCQQCTPYLTERARAVLVLVNGKGDVKYSFQALRFSPHTLNTRGAMGRTGCQNCCRCRVLSVHSFFCRSFAHKRQKQWGSSCNRGFCAKKKGQRSYRLVEVLAGSVGEMI